MVCGIPGTGLQCDQHSGGAILGRGSDKRNRSSGRSAGDEFQRTDVRVKEVCL